MKLSEACIILKEIGFNCLLVREGDFNYLGEPIEELNEGFLRFLTNMKYLSKDMKSCNAILADSKLDMDILMQQFSNGIISVEEPKNAFYELHQYLLMHTDFFENYRKQLCEGLVKHLPMKMGQNVFIDESSIVGEEVIFGHNVVIDKNVIIGNRVVIHNNVVLGTSGLMLYTHEGKNQIVAHEGCLIIEDDCIIMDGCIIHRGLYPWLNTKIGRNSIIGTGVIIAHGSVIGDFSTLIDGAIVLGHSLLGSKSWIGAGSVLKNRLKIGSRAKVIFGSVVAEDIKEEEEVAGFFAVNKMISLINFRKMKR